YDGIDQDCDNRNDFDQDGDNFARTDSVDAYNTASDSTNDPGNLYGNYFDPNVPSGDCDDLEPLRNPGVEDNVVNSVDNNCDGIPGVDFDRDGTASIASGGADCNDNNATIWPTHFV